MGSRGNWWVPGNLLHGPAELLIVAWNERVAELWTRSCPCALCPPADFIALFYGRAEEDETWELMSQAPLVIDKG